VNVAKGRGLGQLAKTAIMPSAPSHPAFRWANTVLANVKNSLLATHRVVGAKHLPRYLGAFAWRFNRRFVLKTIHERLAIAATTTPPMPYRLLKLAGSMVSGTGIIEPCRPWLSWVGFYCLWGVDAFRTECHGATTHPLKGQQRVFAEVGYTEPVPIWALD
jgi:ISXO2-like transposase domain